MIWIPQHMDECPSSGVLSAVLMARFCSFPFFAYVPRYCASWCIIFILCVTSTHLVEPTPSFALRPTLQPQFISNTPPSTLPATQCYLFLLTTKCHPVSTSYPPHPSILASARTLISSCAYLSPTSAVSVALLISLRSLAQDA